MTVKCSVHFNGHLTICSAPELYAQLLNEMLIDKSD